MLFWIVLIFILLVLFGSVAFYSYSHYRSFMDAVEAAEKSDEMYLNSKPDAGEYNHKVYDKNVN